MIYIITLPLILKMKKLIFTILFLSITFGCSNNNQSKNKIAEFELLQRENDSLKRIIADINSKYVFDSISFRDIYSPSNTHELNSNFNVELLVVGYSPQKSYFVKYDSIANGQKINPDTLPQSNGGFKYRTVLKNRVNDIWIDMNVENEYGKKKMGTLHEKIRTKN